MRLISVEMLTDDMELALPIYYKEALVIKAGNTGISKYISNLLNMGVQYIYVEDDKSHGIEIPDVITTQTRYDCKRALRNTMKGYQEQGNIRVMELTDSVEGVIDDILMSRDIQISLNDIGTVDEYTYLHSVNVAVYSLLIGRALNYNIKKMKDLAMGTLLHDVGKTVLEPEIQFKKGRLSEREYKRMKQHVEIGYYILQKNPSISQEAREISLTHHERLDGSGYPRGIQGDQISEYARIISIADVYDALISDRCYKQKWPTNRALDYLIENSGTMFSAELVHLFIQQIAVYPNGSMVELSDGCIGLVKDQNKSVPLRPIVRIIIDKDGKSIKPYEIDLMEILSITIVKSELEIKDIVKKEEDETREFVV